MKKQCYDKDRTYVHKYIIYNENTVEKGRNMWGRETKEEAERRREQAFYEHYGAMGKSTESMKKEWERRKRNERRIERLKRRRRIAIALILFVVLIPIAGGYTYFKLNPIVLKHKVINQEMKENLDLMSNVRFVVGGKASEVKTEGDVDANKEGKYVIYYTYGKHKVKAEVDVKDTKAPELKMKESFTTDLSQEIKPEDFVESVTDATDVKLEFVGQDSWTKKGKYQVTVSATDAGGHKTEGKSTLILEEDTTGPTIEGADDKEVLQGDTMDFEEGVTVKDDIDPNPTLEIQSDSVDFATPGTYTATYIAKDRSGNETKVERKITVKENPDWSEKVVYLTFDDGPSTNTGKILDILKEKGAKGTFFVTGNNQEHDDMIKRAFDEGNSIGLHTFSHDYAKVYASEDAYFQDLQQVSDLVEKITGQKSMILRFPGGSSNTVSAKYVQGLMTQLTKDVRAKGYQYFDWNCDSTDASGNNVPVSTLVSNATSCSADHVNILMHDTDAKDTTVQALPQIIDYYKSQGYTFKGLTVDSVAAHHGVNN